MKKLEAVYPIAGKRVREEVGSERIEVGEVFECPDDMADELLETGNAITAEPEPDHGPVGPDTSDDVEMTDDLPDEDESDAEPEDEDEGYICGYPKSNDEPCEFPVDGPDERCHNHENAEEE